MKFPVATLAFICFLLSPGCGKAQTITITTKRTAQALFAGYYAAQKQGFYQEAGLDVQIKHPSASENTFSLPEQGAASASVISLSYAIMERMGGAPLVNVLQTSQEGAQVIVGHSPLEGMESLRNKKIAVWNLVSQKLLDRAVEYYNMPVEWVRSNNRINVFLSGAVDGCLIMSYNEFLKLEEYGRTPDPACVMRLADYGYSLPEDGLYVTEAFYNQNRETVEELVKATIRGWEWADEHREEALDLVMEEVKRQDVETNRYHQYRMLEEVLRLQVNRQSGQRTYRLSRLHFEEALKLLAPGRAATLTYEELVR